MEEEENNLQNEALENDLENPGLEENIPGELITEEKENLQAEASKKIIQKLLQTKIISIGLVLGGFLLLLVAATSSMEASNIHSKHYKESSCDKITVTYDPYDESQESKTTTMELEEYVRKATYEYKKDFLETPSGTFNVYYALAIALRTEVLANNCQITYKDKDLSNNYERDTMVESALEISEGVTMGDENFNFISAKVSDFCWNTNDTENYQLFQANGFKIPVNLVYTYLSNDVYRDCPCNRETGSPNLGDGGDEYSKCWVVWEEEDEDGNITYDYNYIHYDDESGFSVLGAYYLFKNYGKDYTEILKYFFGDFKWMTTKDLSKIKEDETIANNNNKTNCSDFSLTTTTLSKSEFTSSVRNYQDSHEDWALFQTNAEKIYDMAIENNVNPEIIIVRAILEGFSPGGRKHNYFGINCNNGHPENCSVFSSFDEGILGFINVVHGYDSFVQLSNRYAQLGEIWRNPGDWGNGGCVYAPSIYPDGLDAYVIEACGAAYAGCSGSSCMPTRQQDKEAYALYQSKSMTKKRLEVFGIESNTCTNNTLNFGNCVLYNQADPRWTSSPLGHGGTSIGSAGCALTSIAIAMTCTGQIKDTNAFTPVVLNERLVANGGFDGVLIYWDNPGMREFVPTFRLVERFEFVKATSSEYKISLFEKGLTENTIGIVHIQNSEHVRGHFVVLHKINKEEDTILTLDPGGGLLRTYSIHDIDGFKYYTY